MDATFVPDKKRRSHNHHNYQRSSAVGQRIKIGQRRCYLLRLLLVVRLLEADGRPVFTGLLQERRLLVGRQRAPNFGDLLPSLRPGCNPTKDKMIKGVKSSEMLLLLLGGKYLGNRVSIPGDWCWQRGRPKWWPTSPGLRPLPI